MSEKILVVDDEPDVRLLCRVNLEFEGYEVIEASNGLDALQLIDRSSPDLVLLDVMMPMLDGLQVLEKIRTWDSAPPVILLSAKVQDRDRLQGITSGACEYVTKPFNPVSLSKSVRRALRSKDNNAQRRQRALEKLRFDHSL